MINTHEQRRGVLILVQDLIFATKIRSTAASLGIESTSVRTAQELSRRLAEGPLPLVIVDLGASGDEALRAIVVARERADRPHIVAFVSHVEEELARRASAAGADEVLPRSRFNAQLPALLNTHCFAAHFADRLLQAIGRTNAPVCVGLDPLFERLPPAILQEHGLEHPAESKTDPRDAEPAANALLQFGAELIRIVAPHVPTIKINVAFFEPYHAAGFRTYFELVRLAQKAGLIVIGDVKRGDIGHSAEQYAAAHLGGGMNAAGGPFAADAVTVNSYLGYDGVKPFVDSCRAGGKGVFVLVQTSNPSAVELQQVRLSEGITLAERISKLVDQWSRTEGLIGQEGFSAVGAVVAPVNAETTRRLRESMPHCLFLVPGYGAQGKSAEEVALCFKLDGTGAIVNASRSVIFAYEDQKYRGLYGDDWRRCIEASCRDFVNAIRAVTPSPQT